MKAKIVSKVVEFCMFPKALSSFVVTMPKVIFLRENLPRNQCYALTGYDLGNTLKSIVSLLQGVLLHNRTSTVEP